MTKLAASVCSNIGLVAISIGGIWREKFWQAKGNARRDLVDTCGLAQIEGMFCELGSQLTTRREHRFCGFSTS